MESSEREFVVKLFYKLKNTNITGVHNPGYGIQVNDIMDFTGKHGPYLNKEYAEFIIYMINNFEEILEL